MDVDPQVLEYEPPRVYTYGDLRQLTAGCNPGGFEDGAFKGSGEFGLSSPLPPICDT